MFSVRCSMFDVPGSRQASILIGLLWCVALLSIVVVEVLHTSSIDLMVGKNYTDRIQAHYLALAGIEKAKALLYQNASDRSHSGKNHTGEFYNDAGQFREISFGRGKFTVFRRAREDEGGGIVYGVADEESRLNINTVSTNELQKLQDLTPEIAAAIMDWRGPANQITPGGVAPDYYTSLRPPYKPRNGPFQTVRELLMVRGVTPDLLTGNDTHQNGFINDQTDENGEPSSADNRSVDTDAGWAGVMTVDSSVKNLDAAGQDRVNIQNADEGTLGGINGITPAIARAITSYRNQNQFQSIANLLDVTASQPGQQGQNGIPQNFTGNQDGSTQVTQNTGQAQSGNGGPQVIDANLFMDIADEVTVDTDDSKPGAINVNTASLDVLACLPGVDRELAQAIISFRQSNGFLPNIGHLLQVPGLTPDILKQMAPMITTRSETYRILCEGKITSSGVRQRIQEVVRVNTSDVATLSHREDDL